MAETSPWRPSPPSPWLFIVLLAVSGLQSRTVVCKSQRRKASEWWATHGPACVRAHGPPFSSLALEPLIKCKSAKDTALQKTRQDRDRYTASPSLPEPSLGPPAAGPTALRDVSEPLESTSLFRLF